MNKELLITFGILTSTICAIPAFVNLFGPTLIGQTYKLVLFPVSLFLILDFFKHKNVLTIEWLYIILMVMAWGAHSIITMPQGADPFMESFRWIIIILLLGTCSVFPLCKKWLFYVFLFLFMSECIVAIYEKLTLSNVLDYWSNSEDELFASWSALDYFSIEDFRATALYRHPLNNANVVSLFLAFILCLKELKPSIRYGLLGLGLIALWSFNSRGAMLVWILILLYRVFFYGKNFTYIICSVIILYFLVPWLIDIISQISYLGRITDSLNDQSSETRWLAYGIFALQDWTMERIFFGGELIYMPGTELSLENGVLLNLGYWGWIIGGLKSIIEVAISYYVLPEKLDKRDKFIILFAAWGVAFTNNNSFNTLMLTQFILAVAAIQVVYNNQKNGLKQWYLAQSEKLNHERSI